MTEKEESEKKKNNIEMKTVMGCGTDSIRNTKHFVLFEHTQVNRN